MLILKCSFQQEESGKLKNRVNGADPERKTANLLGFGQ